MAIQFLIPDTARVANHLTIEIDTNLSSYTESFDVKIKNFGMEIPKELVSLFNVVYSTEIVDNAKAFYGNINRRVFSSNIEAFLQSFETMCFDNLTNKVIYGTKVEYTYEPKTSNSSFDYHLYQPNELTVQFDDEEIIFYIDGKEVPEVFEEIQKSFGKNSIKSHQKSNARIIVYTIDPGYYDIKALVQSVVNYLGFNGYQIVNIEQGQYCIDLRNDETKPEVIAIKQYVQFVDTINFEEKPELTLGDLFESMAGIASALIPDETPVIDVVSTTVN